MFCNKCGTRFDENSAFCKKCGNGLKDNAAVFPTTKKYVSSNRRKTFIPLAVILVAVTCVGVLLLLKNDSNDIPVVPSPITTSPHTPAGLNSNAQQSELSGQRLEQILSAGKIVVGTSPDFAPMEFIDVNKTGMDQYVGLDMELARYIANELGVELEIKSMDFSTVLTSIPAGTIDLALTGLAWKEDRAEAMELSDFYNIQDDPQGQGLLVLKSELSDYQTAADFSGKIVAVQEASLQKYLLEDQLPDAEPRMIAKTTDGVLMLLSGRVDAVGVSAPNGRSFIANYPDVAMSGFFYDYSSEGNVAGIMKGETALLEKINEIIQKAASEGLFEKWYLEAELLAEEIGWQNE